MAKQLGVIQFRGSLGETVGSKKAVGQKNNTMRVRVRSIANPKTQAQAMQRMRMTPATNLYRALSEILDHSFQGVPYGAPSHSFFMKHALKGDQFPYVEKGELTPIPGTYLISSGSLPTIQTSFYSNPGDFVGFGIATDKADDATFTMAEFSQAAIEQLGLANGDQLTFVNCLTDDALFEGYLRWDIRRIILNTSSTDEAPSWIVAKSGIICLSASEIGGVGYYTAATAVIVSRPRIRKGRATWLRSTSYLYLEPHASLKIRSASRFKPCLESYMSSQSTNLDNDYYLNQGTADEGDNSGSISGGRMLVAGAFNGSSNALFMSTNGTSRLVVSEDPEDNTRKFYYTYNAGENIASKVRPSVAVTSLPSQYVLMSTVQGYFPNLEVNEGDAIEETP